MTPTHHGAAAAQLGLALCIGPRHLAQAQQADQDVLLEAGGRDGSTTGGSGRAGRRACHAAEHGTLHEVAGCWLWHAAPHLARVAVLQECLPAAVCCVVAPDQLHLLWPHLLCRARGLRSCEHRAALDGQLVWGGARGHTNSTLHPKRQKVGACHPPAPPTLWWMSWMPHSRVRTSRHFSLLKWAGGWGEAGS